MNILSFEFIIFIAIVFMLTMVTNGIIRKILLLISNIFFLLSFGNYLHLLWLVITGIYTYVMGLLIEKNHHKYQLALGIVPIVLSLCFFKYANNFLNIKNFIVPLGISFYTFKMISYMVDVYNKKTYTANMIDFAIYISFFPTFTAGPINRVDNFIKQLNTKYVFDYHNSKNGAVLCAFGMFEKIVFADYLKNIIDIILLNNRAKGIYTIVAVILYSFYIYLDFDGYSNVAIGVSRMLGFNIERNFKTPYLASSIMEFWDRWHISLSNWLKDYVYIPLGGSRKGELRKYLNILIVFIVSGIWHGSTITFVLWGLGHGILNIIENIIKKVTKDINFPSLVKWIGKLLGIALNFTLVTFLWIFFSSGSFENAFNIISRCILFESIDFNPNVIHITQRETYWILIIVVTTIITDILRNKIDMIEWLSKRNFVIRWFVYAAMILIVIIFGVYGPGYNASDFIYNAF